MPAEILLQPSSFLKKRPLPSAVLSNAGATQTLPEQKKLRQAFWWLLGGFLALVAWRGFGLPFQRSMGAMLIILAALLPSFLWVSRKVVGIPIFPLYTVTFTWIYALPLVSTHRVIAMFPPAAQLTAALSITGFLLVSTGVWYLVVRRPAKRVMTCWMVDESRHDALLISVLGICAVLTLGLNSSSTSLGGGVSIVRAVMSALEALLFFILSYRLSQGRLSKLSRIVCLVLMGCVFLDRFSSLLLIGAMSQLGLSVLAYIIGSHKVPWRLCLVSVALFTFLHFGKSEMRTKYWNEEENYTVSPLAFPGFFFDWTVASWHAIVDPDEDADVESLSDRASLMHIFLYIQGVTPGLIPYLDGGSYQAVLPQFVPRIFWADKPASHEGTYLLCIHYGLQTREETETTTIDIGLPSEAYANYGYSGLAGLAVVLGIFFGITANWARGVPIFSFRSLFAVLVLASILQASSSASLYIASLYQATITLVGISLLIMRPLRPNPSRNSILE